MDRYRRSRLCLGLGLVAVLLCTLAYLGYVVMESR